MVTTALKTPNLWSHSPKQALWLHPTPSQLPAKHSSSTPGSDWMPFSLAKTLVWVALPLPGLTHSHPMLSTYTGFPFFHHPSANILWLKKRFKNPTKQTKALRAAVQQLGWRGKPFPSAGSSIPFTCSTSWRLCGPIHHSFHSLSILQLQAKAGFSQEGVG